MFPQGNYTARIVRQGIGESSQKRTPHIWFDVSIIRDANNNSVEPGERQVAIWLTDDAMDVAKKCLQAIGFDIQQNGVEQLDPDHPKHVSMEGTEIQVYCKHETFTNKKGQPVTRDKFQISTGGPSAKPLEAGKRGELKKFTAMLRQGGGGPRPAQRQPAPQPRQPVPANNTTFTDEETI